jgi:hypothetical protein
MPTPSLDQSERTSSPSPDDRARLQLALALRARDGRLVAAAYAALDAGAPGGEVAERAVPDRAQLSLFARPT